MSAELVRQVNHKARAYTASLHPGKRREPSADFLAAPPPERKFNLRIKQEDLDLLDALAKRRGVTRSSLINRLLHDILLEELLSIPEEEIDLRVLIAQTADERAACDETQRPWILNAADEALGEAAERLLRFRSLRDPRPAEGLAAPEHAFNSERFVSLKRKMKDMPK